MAARIPQSFIDEILTRADIVELIDGFVSLKKKGKEYMACCPFHDEKTASFTVSPEKQFYHCFGCGAHGTAIGFLMEYEHLDFVEAVETLSQHLGLEIPNEDTPVIKNDFQELYTLLEHANSYYKKMLREHQNAIDYLKSRDVSGEVAAKFDLGYAPDGFNNILNQFKNAATEKQLIKIGLIKQNEQGKNYDRFRNRIMFPIKDRRGRIIGFGGRAFSDEMPKYLNTPETPVFHKSNALYGLYEARKYKETSQSIIVVECYMDVVALAQHHIFNAVATLGTATTIQHIQQLFNYTQEVVFCFDGDRAGRDAAWRAAQQTIPLFKDGLETKFLFLPQDEDPDSLIRQRGKNIFLQYVKDSHTLSSFIFEKLSESIDIRTPAGKAKLAQQAKSLLSKFPDGVYKKLIFEELEKIVGTPIHYEIANATSYKSKVDKTTTSKITPVRLAISALLHDPTLVAEINTTENLEHADIPGLDLLKEISNIWINEPDLNQAALVERFRGKPEEIQIKKLLAWKSPELDSPKQAFTDAMDWVYRKAKSARIQQLIDKESTSGLSEDERQEFRNLLQQKAS